MIISWLVGWMDCCIKDQCRHCILNFFWSQMSYRFVVYILHYRKTFKQTNKQTHWRRISQEMWMWSFKHDKKTSICVCVCVCIFCVFWSQTNKQTIRTRNEIWNDITFFLSRLELFHYNIFFVENFFLLLSTTTTTTQNDQRASSD